MRCNKGDKTSSSKNVAAQRIELKNLSSIMHGEIKQVLITHVTQNNINVSGHLAYLRKEASNDNKLYQD